MTEWQTSNRNDRMAAVNAIYTWAAYPTRRLVARNPAREVELPPGDEVKRLRIADPAEAAHLRAALDPEDALPYAIGFYRAHAAPSSSTSSGPTSTSRRS